MRVVSGEVGIDQNLSYVLSDMERRAGCDKQPAGNRMKVTGLEVMAFCHVFYSSKVTVDSTNRRILPIQSECWY